jgi:hypothetical protein
MITERNAAPVMLEHEPSPDEARAIAEAITEALQRDVDAYLHALNPKFYAPLKLQAWEAQRLDP